jgi:hypothetical protein
MEENIIKLDLWGGNHFLNKNDLIYNIERDCGLFSNVTISLYGIMKFIELGVPPKKIVLKLLEYKTNYDFYEDLFKTKNIEINFNDISDGEMKYFFRYCEPNTLGIGREKQHINFKILNRLIDKFYQLSDKSENIYNKIINDNQIDFEKTVFIWARKTDKIYETKTPEVDDYIDILKKNNLLDYDIVLQTDDITVYDEFKLKNINFRALNEIPYSFNNKGFHEKLYQINDEQFIDNFGISKSLYLQKLLCLVIIASKSKYVITYPGNLSTVIPILRGNFDNVFNFINEKNLMK